MNHTFTRGFLAALFLFGICGSDGFARCKSLSAEEVGTRLGTVVLEIARAFAQAGVWADPDCRSPRTKELRYLCSLTDEFESAIERVNKAVDRGCFDDKGAYAQSADFYAFRVLKTALSSTDPNLRWQGLMRMFVLCEDATMLTDAGAKGCAQEVEEGALNTLQGDREPFNRHLALEILGSRLVTERSRETLVEVARTCLDLGEGCPHGLLSASSTRQNHLPWDAIAKGFAESKYACEQQLAREALDRLDRRGAAPGQ